MATLSLTDQFGLVIDASPEPGALSAFAKYLKSPAAIAGLLRNPKPLQNIQVGQDPFASLSMGISFTEPISLGVTGRELTINPQLLGTVGIEKGPSLFGADTDPFGDSVPIPDPANQAFVSAGIEATLDVGLSDQPGGLQFGFTSGTDVVFTNYRLFALTDPIVSAIQTLFKSFVIPRDLQDVDAMTPGSLATVEGTGTLKFCGQANLLGAVNPLATLSTSVLSGALQLNAGGSFMIGAACTLTADYQVRVQRLGGRKFRLGYQKKRGSEFEVSVAAQVGVSADVGQFDLIQRVLQMISADPVPGKDAFEQAGLSDGQIATIAAAIKTGIERNLALALTGELDLSESVSTAFSYEVDLDVLDAKGAEAVNDALQGDLTALESSTLVGIKPLKSIFTALRGGQKVLKVNLLGIFNYGSVTSLFQKGTIVVDRESGDITITDQAGASRIQFTSDNFAEDSAKLRKVLAESFLLTAAYRSSGTVSRGPALTSNYWFFELHQQTGLQNMRDYLNIAQALRVLSPDEANGKLVPLSGIRAFGHSTLHIDSSYDESLFKTLFLNAAGQARAQNEYESIGRQALAALLPPGDPINDARRLPLRDDATWNAMKTAGQPNNFGGLFDNRNFNANELGDIFSDYTLITWWAAAMRSLGVALAHLLSYTAENPAWRPEDSAFKKLRSALDGAMASVTENTKDQFAEPWGLLAMDVASGQKAATKVQINCPRLALQASRNPA